jgi:trigger factor
MNRDMETFASEKKIRLAGAPKADVSSTWAAGADLEYTLEFDILPTLPEIDLAKFTVSKKVQPVGKKEIDGALENLRKSRMTFTAAPSEALAQEGDIAVIDFKGFVGKDAFEGGEGKNHSLHLGSGQFIPGFEDQVIGHKVGDKFDVNVSFPTEYHAENLAGKKARFEVEIHEIRKSTLPELNDEFAKTVGQETVAKLREHVEKILTEQALDAAKSEMRNELLEQLSDKVKLSLPDTLVEQEFAMAKREASAAKQTGEAGDKKFDEKQERKDAERRVKLGLILAEWGTANKVEVTREDLQQAIWAEAARYPDPQQVFEFYNKNQNAVSMMRGMLFERKALDAMLSKVKVKESKK